VTLPSEEKTLYPGPHPRTGWLWVPSMR